MTAALELTVYSKTGGPLTKRVALNGDGTVHSDASACLMAQGTAQRLPLPDIGALANAIEGTKSNEALSLGRLRPDLVDRVTITTKTKLNGAARRDLIARTSDNIIFLSGQPALALFDFDTKGMPSAVAARIAQLGGFEAVLQSILPELAIAARLFRSSTSSGLFRADTGERLPGSNGVHGYVAVRDGTDIDRFLKTLHGRCWLAGFGWYTVGAGGQLLDRSIIDRVVGTPERLVFEGPPVLVPPLAQDAGARRPTATLGELLDTIAACPPLSILEQATLREQRASRAERLAPDIAKAREVFIARLAQRTGVSVSAARRTIERQCRGVLLPDVELPFDDPELAGVTVARVLAEPDRFVGETLADPLEGIDYGRAKAKIMRRADAVLWINSFAHGRTVYELRYDFKAIAAILEKTPIEDLAEAFVEFAMLGDLDPIEIEKLRNLVSQRAGIGKRALADMVRQARATRSSEQAKQKRERRIAERQDPRPLVPVPASDAEWYPTMKLLNDVLANSTAAEPPMRDREDDCAWIKSGGRAEPAHTHGQRGQ
jgi:hypothetical protein